MGLRDTTNKMKDLLEEICIDISKAENGNKAAAQRVRVHSIDLEKIAKLYRKESVAAEKKGTGPKKPSAKKAAKSAKKKK